MARFCARSSTAGTRGFADLESLRETDQLTETDEGFVIESAQRTGPAPEVISLPDVESEVAEVVTRVRDSIRAEEVRPEEIVIQIDQKWSTLAPYTEERLVDWIRSIPKITGCQGRESWIALPGRLKAALPPCATSCKIGS